MSAPLLLFRSLWTNGFSLEDALEDVAEGTFDGIEGPVPDQPLIRRVFTSRLRGAAVPFIAEIVTGGDYVPRHRSLGSHRTDLRHGLDAACAAEARFATILAGCDHWPLAQAVEFLGDAIEAAHDRKLTVSFETHRSRPTFNPWATAELLRQLPALRLTCDFSHWCCVCERLVLDEEPALLQMFAERAQHIHARVGYAQGPQVPHPAAPEHRKALEAHERWWSHLIAARTAAGGDAVTMTPEFGPDGYLQARPFTGAPIANLDEINRWMAQRLRERFGRATRSAAEPDSDANPESDRHSQASGNLSFAVGETSADATSTTPFESHPTFRPIAADLALEKSHLPLPRVPTTNHQLQTTPPIHPPSAGGPA